MPKASSSYLLIDEISHRFSLFQQNSKSIFQFYKKIDITKIDSIKTNSVYMILFSAV